MKNKLLVLLSFALVLMSCQQPKKTKVKSFEIKKPNVLLIAVDDLNDWIGVLGGIHKRRRQTWIDWPNVVCFLAMPIVSLQCAIRLVPV